MTRARVLLRCAATLLLAAAGAAQQPIMQPDDFVDPASYDGKVFMSRIVFGGAMNLSDHARPLDHDPVFVVLTNSLYFRQFQFDYKHTELAGGGDAPPVQRCDCPDPVYFPTPAPGNETPPALASARIETLQAGFYKTISRGEGRAPATLRYQLYWQWRGLDTDVTSASTGRIVERRSGREQSFGLVADTFVPLGARVLWGTVSLARTSSSGTIGDRAQTEVVYTARFPGWAAGSVLIRTNLAVGGISGRGAAGLNLVNPSVEAFWRHRPTKINVHLVWSPLATRDGAEGWRTKHQVVLFVDRLLYMKMFGR